MIKDIIFYVIGAINFAGFTLAMILSAVMFAIYHIFNVCLRRPYDNLHHFVVNNPRIRSLYRYEDDVEYFLPSVLTFVYVLIMFFTNLFIYQIYGWHEYWIYQFLIYWSLWLGPFNTAYATVSVMAHKEGHFESIGIYKNKNWVLNHLFEFVIGPIYGILPNIFSIIHRKVHHIYHGGFGDEMTCWDCKRNNVLHFIWYNGRIFLHSIGFTPIIYFWLNGKKDFLQRMINGCLGLYGFWFAIWLLTDIYFVLLAGFVPLLFTSSLYACFNWVWHGFIDPDDQTNKLIINTNIVEGTNNVWGEDFHYYHHKDPLKPWQFAKDDFDHTKKEPGKVTVFKKCHVVDLFLRCMIRDHGWFADNLVDDSLTREQKKALIKRRLEFLPKMPAEWRSYYKYF